MSEPKIVGICDNHLVPHERRYGMMGCVNWKPVDRNSSQISVQPQADNRLGGLMSEPKVNRSMSVEEYWPEWFDNAEETKYLSTSGGKKKEIAVAFATAYHAHMTRPEVLREIARQIANELVVVYTPESKAYEHAKERIAEILAKGLGVQR